MTDVEGTEIRYLGDVQRLAVRTGDVVVLSLSAEVSPEEMKWVREAVKQKLPEGVELLILPKGDQIGVLGVEGGDAE